MNRKSIERIKSIFIIVFVLFSSLFLLALVFFPAIPCAIVYILSLSGLLFVSYRTLSQNLDLLFVKISRTIDSLVQDNKEERFSLLDDNMLSRFQHQIIRLAEILKGREEDSIRQQKSISAALSHIAHQLKTPLTNLNIYIRMLKEGEMDEAKRMSTLNILTDQVMKLNWLMEQLMQMSRLDSGAVDVKPEQMILEPVLLEAIDSVRPKALGKEQNISLSGKAEISIRIDRKWMGEAVFNLLDNAVKYSREKSVISLNLVQTEMFFYIEISDTATPIPESEINLIFNRFYRGKENREEGAGLGLYLARQIVEAHRGFIQVKPGLAGNRFSIALPVNGSL